MNASLFSTIILPFISHFGHGLLHLLARTIDSSKIGQPLNSLSIAWSLSTPSINGKLQVLAMNSSSSVKEYLNFLMLLKNGLRQQEQTSSKASKMSILGWWIVHTTVRPVSTVFRTVRITMAAARASRPLVGSSMNIMEGLATSSTAIVNLFLCSVDNPVMPGNPTKAFSNCLSSTKSKTSSTNACKKTAGISASHDS